MVDPSRTGDLERENELGFDNPNVAYRPFVIMEELLEKLKLINYDIGFCRDKHYKPISRYVLFRVTIKKK